MGDRGDSLAAVAELVDEAHWALESAALVLGVDPNPITVEIRGHEVVQTGLPDPYALDTLQAKVNLALVTEWALRETIKRLREKTSYSAEDLRELAINLNELALRVQYLSTIGAVKPAYQAYDRQVRTNPNLDAMVENQRQFATILRALATGSNRRIARLSELRDIDGIPRDALAHFMDPGEKANDRRAWLREHLKRAGHYVGRRGRPRKARSAVDRKARS